MSERLVLVDDHLLLSLLRRNEPQGLRPRGARVLTTGLFYHRLCRAVSNPTGHGALSNRLGALDASLRAAVVASIVTLPPTIALASLRELAWPMAQLLRDGVKLNLLSLEALAAAEDRGAELCLAAADHNPTLLAAAGARGVSARLIDT